MTPNYFETVESLTFLPGQIVVLSGDNLVDIYNVLANTKTALVAASIPCLDPIDTRATTFYPTGIVAGGFTSTTTVFKTAYLLNCAMDIAGLSLRMTSGALMGQTRTILNYDTYTQVVTTSTPFTAAPSAGDAFVVDVPDEVSFNYEFLAIQNRAGGPSPHVVLVGNQFDLSDIKQNPLPVDIYVDTVRDLLNIQNVGSVPQVMSNVYPLVRELFPYISKIYYYNSRANDITFVKNQIPERP